MSFAKHNKMRLKRIKEFFMIPKQYTQDETKQTKKLIF